MDKTAERKEAQKKKRRRKKDDKSKKQTSKGKRSSETGSGRKKVKEGVSTQVARTSSGEGHKLKAKLQRCGSKEVLQSDTIQSLAEDESLKEIESLRWCHQLEDEKAEEKRLEDYKSARRQRYLSLLEQQRSQWVADALLHPKTPAQKHTYYLPHVQTKTT